MCSSRPLARRLWSTTIKTYPGILVGLHDEIFQGTLPVLAGVDAASTYCYLLAVAEHRDADTWGVQLLTLPGRTET